MEDAVTDKAAGEHGGLNEMQSGQPVWRSLPDRLPGPCYKFTSTKS